MQGFNASTAVYCSQKSRLVMLFSRFLQLSHLPKSRLPYCRQISELKSSCLENSCSQMLSGSSLSATFWLRQLVDTSFQEIWRDSIFMDNFEDLNSVSFHCNNGSSAISRHTPTVFQNSFVDTIQHIVLENEWATALYRSQPFTFWPY